jgi:hypothetical protein
LTIGGTAIRNGLGGGMFVCATMKWTMLPPGCGQVASAQVGRYRDDKTVVRINFTITTTYSSIGSAALAFYIFLVLSAVFAAGGSGRALLF